MFLHTREISDIDVLDWWSNHGREFPNLQILAKKYLTACATSVASERLFSLAGHVVSKRRSSLKPQMVNMLVSLAYNNKG